MQLGVRVAGENRRRTLGAGRLNKVFGDMVCGAQQQVEIKLDDHHGALLRHGRESQTRAGQLTCG